MIISNNFIDWHQTCIILKPSSLACSCGDGIVSLPSHCYIYVTWSKHLCNKLSSWSFSFGLKLNCPAVWDESEFLPSNSSQVSPKRRYWWATRLNPTPIDNQLYPRKYKDLQHFVTTLSLVKKIPNSSSRILLKRLVKTKIWKHL